MSNKATAVIEAGIKIANMFNATVPGIASLLLLIVEKNGAITIMPILDAAEEGFEKALTAAAKWKRDHPKKSL